MPTRKHAVVMFACSTAVFGLAAAPDIPDRLSAFLRRVIEQRSKAAFERNLELDPPIGERLVVTLEEVVFSEGFGGRRDVVLAGNYDPEVFGRLSERVIASGDNTTVFVVVGHANSEELENARTTLGKAVQVIADPDGRIHAAWNAFFAPRHYVVSEGWKLVSAGRAPYVSLCGTCGEEQQS